MKLLKISFLIFFLSFSITTMFSQEAQTETINEGSINEQFDFILRKSGNFKSTNGQAYEAVKQSWILALKSHTLDSLKTIRKSLNDTKIVVNNQTKEISDLKSKLTNTQSDLDKTNLDKDSMALFGLQMSKANYNMLMWSIIAILLALLILFIYKFKNSNTITKDAKKALGEIEEEFDEHRRVALEREQKVRRQLQDEINKQKGI